ncbi:MAG: Ig-like domain-containing protein [candidate division KSB1 bacterium]|nr:Ig-like domain-containing protein [candidate division KSB1 bacterium]
MRWTAPGDDGTTGNASSYDIRYSTGLITSANFSSATKATGIPIPSAPGTTESFQITGLLPSTTYYFALKTADEVSNWSPMSNVVSTTTLSATTIVDNFNRPGPALGSDWVADPEFKIVSGELANTSTEERWDFMAVYKARKNPTEVSIKWGTAADAEGIGEGGLALMLDAASPNASGYLAWIRTDVRKLYMYTIVSGVPGSFVGGVPFSESLPNPQAGDVFKVVMSSDASGHHFDYYVNDQLYGQITDPSKQQGTASVLYAGVMLHGNRNNNIDDFTLTSPKGVATELLYVWGNNQTGTVNKRLPDSLVVRAIDANSNPVDGVPVNFTIKEGSGKLSMPTDKNIRIEAESGTLTSPMQIASDANASGGQYIYVPSGYETGMATYTVQIATAGDYRIWGRVIGPDESSNSVYVSIDGGAESRWKFRPPSASWFWNLVCHVHDDGYEERPKIFSLTAGNHTLKIRGRQAGSKIDKLIFTTDPNFVPSGKEDLQTPMTDQNGQTYAILTLGTTIGRVRVEATSSGLNTISFTARAVADSAKTLVKTSGDNQTGKGGQPLANPFVVTVYDKYNNPVSMVPVTFTVIKGGGTLSNLQPVYTDTLGQASTVLTLGTEADTNKVQASSPGLQGSPVTFTARATEGIATKLVYVSGTNQTGTVKTPLGAPFKVKVVDSQDKPVANHKVRFKVTAGGGTLDGNTVTEKDVLTGTDGIAQVVLTLGQTAGTNNNTVEATATRAGQPLTGSPYNFVASANPDVANEIKLVSGNNQTGAPGMPLAAPFVVKVVDKYNNPIAGHSVTFTVTAGDGTLDGSTDKTKTYLTEADGTTRTKLTLGSTPGVTNRVQASASRAGNPLTGSPVTFEAIPGVASKIVYVAGNNQTGSAGWPLADSCKVQIQDNYGNPYGGYTVTFTVTEGNGTLDGTSQTTKNVTTNINGIAKVLLTLGPTPGASNKVQASAVKDGQPLTNSPITFTARAVGLSKLSKVSGDSLSGTVGTPLAQPFKVLVRDSLNKAIAGWPVTFAVKSGNGNFGGQSQTTVNTNSSGIAEATLTLGPTPGQYNNVAEATALYNGKSLSGSPVTFRASGVIGNPSQLIYVSGNGQKSVVGNPLPEPFKVKVGDSFGNAISGHPVTFVVTSGGGTLDGNTDKEKTVPTNSQGIAQVTLTLGPTSGDSNNVVEARSFYNSNPLTNSPMVFKASARPSAAQNLLYISGDGQTGTAGKPLAEPFKVKVTDKGTNPVPNHPVEFKVVQGGGNFGGGAADTVKLQNTNSQGIAEVLFTLGPKVGTLNNIVKASSTNGPDVLTGSPILFKASAISGKPDANVSTITATTPVPADGSSTSTVTVTLMDAYGNPVSNKVVFINATGSNNSIIQPPLPTNSEGQATGYIASTKAEVKTVSARDVTDTLDLNGTAKVRFTHLAASMVSLHAGTGQTGNKGAVLKDPIQVKVLDMYANPVPGFPVTFEVTEGGGLIVGSQPAPTDSNGIASAHWILGTTATIHRAKATAAGLLGSPIEFIATGLDGVASKLAIDSGNDQTGTAGETLPKPLVTKVTDSQNRPVWNVPVTFEVTSGGGTFGGNSSLVINTDAFGCAAAYLTLGPTVGTNTVKATAQGVSGSVTFIINGVAGMAAMISKVSGDQQSATIGNALPEPLVVKVTDINNNAKPGYQVPFEVVQGTATIAESQPVTTNNEGKASARITFGTTAGTIIVEARATGLMGSPVRFTEKATATSPVAMAVYSGNNQQGTISRELVYPVGVLVTDGHNNPVENVSITFAVTEGGGSLLNGSSVTTNASGVAYNRWVLGPNTGKNELWAIKTGLSGSPITFTATGVTNKFPIISELKDTTITEAQSLQFQVNAEDEDKDPVTYGARGLPSGASYDSTGSRKFSWTPSYAQAGVLGLILLDVLLNVAGQLSLKFGMSKLGNFALSAGSLPAVFLKAAFNPYVLLGLFCYGMGFLVWLIVLAKAEVSYAYPMISLGYVLTAVLAWQLFGENVTFIRLAGIFVTCLGVFIIARS